MGVKRCSGKAVRPAMKVAAVRPPGTKRAMTSSTGPRRSSCWAAHAWRRAILPWSPAGLGPAAPGPAADRVGEVVAEHGAGRGGGDERDHVEPALPGQHATQHHRALAGEDGHDHVERRQHQDQDVRQRGQLGEEVEGDHRSPSFRQCATGLVDMTVTLSASTRRGHRGFPRGRLDASGARRPRPHRELVTRAFEVMTRPYAAPLAKWMQPAGVAWVGITPPRCDGGPANAALGRARPGGRPRRRAAGPARVS